MSQPQASQPQHPPGPFPPRDEVKEQLSKIVDDVGPQNLSVRMLRKRLESIFKVDLTPHGAALEELIVEKLNDEKTQIHLAKVEKSYQEGLVAAGKGKKRAKKAPGSTPSRKSAKGEADAAPAKRPAKEKKPDNYPKPALTAFMLFSQEKRSEAAADVSGVMDVARKLGEMWASVSEDEKAQWKARAEEEKKRHDREMEEYVAGGGTVIARASKRGPKVAEGPKRPMTAFMFFSQAKRGELMKQRPELKITDVAKELGTLWQATDTAARQEFEAMVAADKERYARECAEQGIPVKEPKPKTSKPKKKPAKRQASASASSSSGSSSSSSSSSSDSSSSSSDSDSSSSDSSSSSSSSDNE